MSVQDMFIKTKRVLSNNSPAILTGAGVVGVVATVFVASKGSIRAYKIIEEAKKKESIPNDATFRSDPKLYFLLTWREYIPTVAVAVATVLSIVSSAKISQKRAAGLASAYVISEQAYKSYKEHVQEVIGKEANQEIQDKIAEEEVKSNPVSDREVIITGNGDVLCYDSITGRYFNSNIEKIRKAQNDVNELVINHMYASLSDFYRAIGLSSTAYSDEIGWNTDNMLDINFTTTISDDNRPCVVLNYRFEPIRDYHKFG